MFDESTRGINITTHGSALRKAYSLCAGLSLELEHGKRAQSRAAFYLLNPSRCISTCPIEMSRGCIAL